MRQYRPQAAAKRSGEPRYGAVMSSREWDARYASHDDGMWSGRANGVLVAELAGASAGRALDVGCGEGADAIWLAGAGWQVTGIDVSEVALERAAAAARAAGVSVEWLCADIATAPLATGGYDLVSVHYPALKPSPGDDAIRALLAAVAPGGTLLVVGHASARPRPRPRARAQAPRTTSSPPTSAPASTSSGSSRSTRSGRASTRCPKARRTCTTRCCAPSDATETLARCKRPSA